MNQTSKKLFSVLLTVVMLFSLGTPAMATDGQQPDTTEVICTGISGVECAAATHVEGCNLYKAPVVTCKGDAAVANCAAENHIKGCTKYIPVCSALEGCDAEQNVHNAECELYVAPIVCTKGEDCAAATHEADCANYVAPCKEGCAVEGEHDVCMTADEIAAAKAEADEKAKAEAEAALIADIEARIAALPTSEAIQAMDMDALTALNGEITAISLEIDKLSDKSVIDTTSIAAAANELNARIATLESNCICGDGPSNGIYTEGCPEHATEIAASAAKVGNIYYSNLSLALVNAGENEVVLNKDIMLNSTVIVEPTVTLNLNEHNITTDGALYPAIRVRGALTVTGNGTISSDGDVFYVGNKDQTNSTASLVLGEGVNVTSESDCAVVMYDGTTTINGAALRSNSTSYAAIQGSGKDFGDLTINSGSVTSASEVAIYWPQNGTLTVNGGSITGATGIYAKQGNVNINGGSITGNGAAVAYSENNNGGDSTGDALVLERCSYGSLTANIAGGSFSSTHGKEIASYAASGHEAMQEDEYIAEGYEFDSDTGTVKKDVTIDTAEELKKALKEGGEITLGGNIEVGETITIPTGVTAVLNLKGKTITGSGATVLQVNGNLTVKNGTITNAGEIFRVGLKDGSASGTLTVESGTYTSTVSDTVVVLYNGTANLNGGTLESKGEASSTYAAVQGSGSSQGTTTLNIAGATVTSERDVAVYHPQNGELNISSGTITGTTAVYAKQGSVNITGGTLTATKSEYAAYNPYNDGCYATGDTVVLEKNAASYGDLKVTISDGTFIKAASGADYVGSYAVNNGEELTEEDYMAADKMISDGKVISKTYEAQVGETKYESLEAAVAAANGKTITLLSDVTLDDTLNITTNTVIEGNYTLLGTIVVAENASLTADGMTVSGAKITITYVEGGPDTETRVVTTEKGKIQAEEFTITGAAEVNGNGITLKKGTVMSDDELSIAGPAYMNNDGDIRLDDSSASIVVKDANGSVTMTITGPALMDSDGTLTIKDGGSLTAGKMTVIGPATVADDKIAAGAGAAVTNGDTDVELPAGGDVAVNKDGSVVINPTTEDGADKAKIEGIGTATLPAMGTVTVKADGSVVLNPTNVYVDTNNNGKYDKDDVNYDRDGNGKPDLNVDKNGNYKVDDGDDNVDTDGNGKPNYKVIKGTNQVWYYGNTWGLTVTVNGLFEDAKYGFQYVEIDDVKLDVKHYTAKSGSTIVTLDYDYLQTLSVGKHTLTVVYPDGEASTSFYIREASIVPDTGDNSNVGMWAAVFGSSLIALGVAAIVMLKKKREET